MMVWYCIAGIRLSHWTDCSRS